METDPIFAAGDWIGVELEEGGGKNDGSVLGKRYFQCEMGHGMFVRPSNITIIDRPAQPPKAPAPARKPGRPSSVVAPAARRTTSVPDNGVAKRKSMNAPSPSPMARRPSGPSGPSGLRVCRCLHSNHAYSDVISSLPRNLLQNNYILQALQ